MIHFSIITLTLDIEVSRKITLTSLKIIGLLHGKAQSFLGAQLQIRDDRIASQGSIVLVHAMHTYLESLTVNKLSFLPRYRLTYLVII